jgi:acyl-CoA oxidase
LELVEAGTAHSYLWMYQNFYEKIYLKTKNERARAVLIKLLLLYGLEKIVERSSSFYEMGVISSSTLKNIQNLREKLLAELRPDALTIVESFEYDDNTLHSAIGAADGNVYERLLDWSKNYNVVNKEEVRKELVEEIKKAKSQLKPKL